MARVLRVWGRVGQLREWGRLGVLRVWVWVGWGN